MDEYAYVVNVDGVITRDGDHLLIERAADEDHAAGLLGLPGGKLEAPPGSDEALETTVRRELAEEVGLEVGTVEYVCSGTFEADTGNQCLNVVMACEYTGGEPTAAADDEVAAVHWLSMSELRAHENVPSFTEAYIERAMAVRDGR